MQPAFSFAMTFDHGIGGHRSPAGVASRRITYSVPSREKPPKPLKNRNSSLASATIVALGARAGR